MGLHRVDYFQLFENTACILIFAGTPSILSHFLTKEPFI